ncbi:MAG: DinB family protein [Chloroflexi bacterium]|nr:DinB family protein [Chloroflexota bacterium]
MSDIDQITQQLQDARAELLEALNGVTQAEFDHKPVRESDEDEDHWSILEVLWHIGMVEDRFRRTIDQALDGRKVTTDSPRERPVHMTTPALLIEWIKQARRPTESLLRRLTDADLAVEIPRPDGSTRTPLRYLQILVSHDRDHAGQVRALREMERLPAGGEA